MTTHAYIAFRTTPTAPQHPVVLYQHDDGYPDGEDGILEVLAPYARRFALERRSGELDLLIAGVMRAFERRLESRRLHNLDRMRADPDPRVRAYADDAYGQPTLLGARVMVNIDMSPARDDQSYMYLVDAQGGIEVRPPVTDGQGGLNTERPRMIPPVFRVAS